MQRTEKSSRSITVGPAYAVSTLRHDWRLAEVEGWFAMPFNDLLYHAQTVHREHFDPNEVQLSSLLSIKTGACSEDCAYCPQSIRHDASLQREELMEDRKSVV